MSAVTTYAVTGLTCEHCVHSVSTEISSIAGVTNVNVDLVVGGASVVTVTADSPITDQDIAGALDEAGDYVLVTAS